MTDSPNEPHDQEVAPTYVYYAPSEVLLYVEHSEPLQEGDDSDFGSQLLKELFAAHPDLRKFLEPEYFQWADQVSMLTFTRPDDSNPYPHFTLFRQPTGNFGSAEFAIQFGEVVGHGLEYSIRDETVNIRFNKPAMNWYSGAATHTAIGTHGSGKHARPILNEKRLEGLKFIFERQFEADLIGYRALQEAQGVDVFVLDTVPPPQRIQNAWATWGEKTLRPFQRILERTNPDTNTKVYETAQATYIYAEPHDFDGTGEIETDSLGRPCLHYHVIRDWDEDGKQAAAEPELPCDDPDEIAEYLKYDVSDHGLFVAGIIHDIAPEAKIYVIESMNQYGIGTLWNILAGFNYVTLHANHYRRSIINCSLTLSFPTPDHKGYMPGPSDEGILELAGIATPRDSAALRTVLSRFVEGSSDLKALQDNLDQTVALVSSLFEEVRKCVQEERPILSSSGNDSNRDRAKAKPARFLAETQEATGVGALKKDGLTPASYSNDADIPLNDGFLVFGGDYSEPARIAYYDGIEDYLDSGQGIIGIYTAEKFYRPNSDEAYLDEYANENGYAEWAGTSFATPVLAGTIAKVCLATGLAPKVALETFIAARCAPDDANKSRRFIAVSQYVG